MEPRVGTSALPYGLGISLACQAKAAIDNCRAGRAAKGATLGDAGFGVIIYPYIFTFFDKNACITIALVLYCVHVLNRLAE